MDVRPRAIRPTPRSNGIEPAFADHRLGLLAGGAERSRIARLPALRELADETLELALVTGVDEGLVVLDRQALLVLDRHRGAMSQPLRDHEAVDAVGREVFHVTV